MGDHQRRWKIAALTISLPCLGLSMCHRRPEIVQLDPKCKPSSKALGWHERSHIRSEFLFLAQICAYYTPVDGFHHTISAFCGAQNLEQPLA
jgi:hypothetical protein